MSMPSTRRYDEQVPVLIVGGSLVGLSMALFLSRQGIPCLLVERHPGTSPFIRAGGFNPRTMEIYRAAGVESDIRQAEPQNLQNLMILRVESLLGKEISSYTQRTSDFNSVASPEAMSFITQDLLEPVLHVHAAKSGADLRFNTQLLSSIQDADGVTAVIQDRASGKESTVRARYLVAADGNDSPLRNQLGIAVHGPGTLSHQMFIIFKADLRAALRDRPILLCYISNDQVQGATLGAYPGGTRGVLSVPYDPAKGEREEDFAGSHGIALIRAAVGAPDLAVEIESIRAWEMAAFVAERFQQEHIFLAGDSAHVMPPTGGFGANTGIADAHNLAWKLALVLKGLAGPELLSTYEAERRPVAQFTVDQAYANFVERLSPQLARTLTIVPVKDYNAVIFGYRYSSSAILSNGAEQKLYDDPYRPGGQPGMRAPYIELAHNDRHFSTVDLLNQHFVLLSGGEGSIWQEAAHEVAEQFGIALHAYRIGEGGDFIDSNGDFLSAYELAAHGAVLVRPDGFIGWKAAESGQQPALQLEQALARLLSR